MRLPASGTTAAALDLATPATLDEFDWTTRPYSRQWPGRRPLWHLLQDESKAVTNKDSSSSSSIGAIAALLIMSAVLLIGAILGLYSCSVAPASKNRHGAADGARRGRPGPCSPRKQYPRRDPDAASPDDDDDEEEEEEQHINLRDIEAHVPTPEADAFVVTARQGRVYGPGAASIVDIRGGGKAARRRCGLGSVRLMSASSASSATSVDPPPDLRVAREAWGRERVSYSRVRFLSLGEEDDDQEEEALRGSGMMYGAGLRRSMERLSLREALSDEGMMGWAGGCSMSRDRLSLREALSDGSLGMEQGSGGSLTSTDPWCPRDALPVHGDMEPLLTPKGKRQRNVLRKKVTSGSKQLLSDMLKAYGAA